jgi:hypothetical protein
MFWVLSLIPFWSSLRGLVSLSRHDERYSHVVLIPLISLYLIYLERNREADYCPRDDAFTSAWNSPLLRRCVVPS